MSETKLVTMFIPLGRENWSGFERSDLDYINYFKKWAMIKNYLYIFTVSKYKETVLKIRDDFGLLDKTKVIVFDDYLKCDEKLYVSMKNTMLNSQYVNYRYNKNRPETQSYVYNYVMMLKYYCLNQVSEKIDSSDILVWHDFGWHYDMFNFNSKLDFTNINKIQIYNVDVLDDNTIFNIVKWTKNYITGATIALPSSLANDFWNLMREVMISMNRCGLCDQDQTVLLMAYREKPELFNVVPFCNYRDIFAQAANSENEYIENKKSSVRIKIHKIKIKIINRLRKIIYGLRQMYE